jgi:hypothetical protein
MTGARRTDGNSRMKDGGRGGKLHRTEPIRKMLVQSAKSIPILGQIDCVVEGYEEDSGLRGSGEPEVGPHGWNGLMICSHDTRNHNIDRRRMWHAAMGWLEG